MFVNVFVLGGQSVIIIHTMLPQPGGTQQLPRKEREEDDAHAAAHTHLTEAEE